ncbi:Fungal specific transcription factor domain-containing protein [Cladophialophora immunda]|nr:Fungal specific transcription factor domain-containing protein [Cladophialophora immunda]
MSRYQDQAASGPADSADEAHAPCDRAGSPVTGPTGSETRSNDAAADDLNGHGLLEFFQHGISTQSWSRFDSLDEARMCYVGTPISNLAYLVSQERCGDETNLHFPIPQVHREVSWTIGSSLPSLRLRPPLESDLNSLPVKEVRDALIEAFFRDIYPIFPILDEAEWRYHCASKDSPPPLLLYQAILLAGAHVCQHPKVVESRSSFKAALFHRAKALWDLRFENDRVILVQTALLFSWHTENSDSVSANHYYWISVAAGIAFGLGMHRNLASSATSTAMPPACRTMFRRMWWTLFQCAVAAALEYGRPLVTPPSECDQPALTEEDLLQTDGSKNTNINLQYCVRNSQLCEIVADILYAFSPGSVRTLGHLQDTSVLDSRLATWIRTLPPGNDFYTLHLRLHYNSALLHLHRTVIQEARSPVAALTHSSKLCESAAETLVGILSSMIQSGTIRRCYFTASTAVMAAAIQFIREMRGAIAQNSSLLALQAQDRLEGCFPVMNELTRYWPATSATLKLFQHVLETTKPMMNSHFNDQISRVSSGAVAVDAASQDLGPDNWDSMFSNLYTIAPEPDWSNIESWFGVSPYNGGDGGSGRVP